MLPIITVGLTPAGRAAAERIPGDRTLAHYDTAEEALWTIGNENVTGETGDPSEPVQLDDDGRKWLAHVIYGDDAIGPLLAHTVADTKPVEVPCTGLIMVVTDSLGDDQFSPRRIIDGTPESREVTRQAAGAVGRLHAQALLVVDQLHETPHWPAAIEHQLQRAEEQRPPTSAVDQTAAADASRAVNQLNAMIARGQHRPGHFEERGRRR
jgi:hypothetical protein